MDYRKIGFWQLLALSILLTFVAQFIHEAGHCAVYQLLGTKPVWSVNSLAQIWDDTPLHPENWSIFTTPNGKSGWIRMSSAPSQTEHVFGLLAGPLASLFGIILGLALVRFRKETSIKQIGVVLVLTISLPMVQYYLRSPWRHTGDEYFVAAYLDIPKYIIDLPFGFLFLMGFILTLQWLGSWKTKLKWLGITVLGSTPVGLFIIYINGWVISQINQENRFFQPLLGFALPVFIFNVVVLALVGIWSKYGSTQDYKAV
ncbi:MAG: hypothetical protein JNK32_06500 [Anaerolineales bacterium]|nr:hypothetical protein [Anaerolineales bacterium]